MDPRVVGDADDVRGVVPGHWEPAVDCANGHLGKGRKRLATALGGSSWA